MMSSPSRDRGRSRPSTSTISWHWRRTILTAKTMSCTTPSPENLFCGHGMPLRELGACSRKILGERSEEHTSELQSPMYLVCRLLLEKKKKKKIKDKV